MGGKRHRWNVNIEKLGYGRVFPPCLLFTCLCNAIYAEVVSFVPFYILQTYWIPMSSFSSSSTIFSVHSSGGIYWIDPSLIEIDNEHHIVCMYKYGKTRGI